MGETKEAIDLKEILPIDQITENNECHYLGNSGKVTVFPKNEEEIVRILQYSSDKELKVSVIGNGTKRGFGGLMDSYDLLLSLSQYKGIVEHAPGDMTVTVKAGTPFCELQSYLASYNQMIAIDVSHTSKATIGGIIAANDSGPKRLGYGSARDSVIGMKLVYPDGTVIRTGGKVVKNVAGYDMNKLFIGSMGTLAVVSEITFKLRPIPKCENLVLLNFDRKHTSEARHFITELFDSTLEPTAVQLLTPQLASSLNLREEYTVAISFEDVENSVKYQVDALKNKKPENFQMTVLQETDAKEFWQFVANSGPSANEIQGENVVASIKIGVKNLDVLQVLMHLEQLEKTYEIKFTAHGSFGTGLCQVNIEGSSQYITDFIQEVQLYVSEIGGYTIVTHLPFSLRQKVDVWGGKPDHFFLLQGIKGKIDPKNILNYQRFVGGI